MRKLLLAVATCGLLAAGTAQPADAQVFFGFGVGGPGYYHHHYGYGPHCTFHNVRVKVWSPRLHRFVWRWRTRRYCW
jgi:hypothetical protein